MAKVYVGGFVDVFSYPKQEKALYLDPDTISGHLPLSNPIPLNIEHILEAHVGWTIGLHVTKYGLFCLGVVTSDGFLNLVNKLCIDSNVAQSHHTNLPPQPTLEMLHTWLPELSLSSIHPNNSPSVDKQNNCMFQHVSLCAMGKRRGTVAVYGYTLDWIISRFTSLSDQEKKTILSTYDSFNDLTLPQPDFTCSNEILMAKAIDASFIKNRLDILKTDKGVADVTAPTYLKASVQAHSTNPDPDQSVPKTFTKITMNPSTFTTPISTQHEDLISVPRSTFMSMLQTNLDTMKQSSIQKAPNTLDNFVQQPHPQRLPLLGYPGQVPYYGSFCGPTDIQAGYTPYISHPAVYLSLPQATQDFLKYGGIGHMYSPIQHPARPNKRKRDGDDEYESPLFPGEIQKDFQSLSKSITAIQNELKDIKNSTITQTKVPTPPIHQPYTTHQTQAIYPPEFINPITPPNGYYLRYVNPFPQDGTTVSHGQCTSTKPDHCVPVSTNQQPTEKQTQNVNTQPQPSDQVVIPKTTENTVSASTQPVYVDASNKPTQISQLQRIFCDELLNKK